MRGFNRKPGQGDDTQLLNVNLKKNGYLYGRMQNAENNSYGRGGETGNVSGRESQRVNGGRRERDREGEIERER